MGLSSETLLWSFTESNLRDGVEDEKGLHKRTASSRAEKFYRYEMRLGSNSVSVTSIQFEITETREVPGWTGRFCTTGKAFIEYYDSKGLSYSRMTSEFEVLTERKDGNRIEIVDFTRKN